MSKTVTILRTLRRSLRRFEQALLKRGSNRLVILPESPVGAVGEDPIFIVGCPRSGTSLLRRIIDSHSRIACPPESWFLIPLLSMLDDRRSMLGLEGLGFDRATVLARLRAFAGAFLGDYARANGKPRWADKTPFYINALDAIDEVFGASPRYIVLHRNGLDVAHSMARSLGGWMDNEMPDLTRSGIRVPEVMAAAYWRDQVEKIESFRETHHERCHVLHYEALCREPTATLRPLCTFLGEDFEETMIDFHRFRHDDGIEDGSVKLTSGIEPVIGNYREWDTDTLKSVLEEAEPMLGLLGYAASDRQ